MKKVRGLSSTIETVCIIGIVLGLIAIGYLIGYNRGSEDLIEQVGLMCYALKYMVV